MHLARKPLIHHALGMSSPKLWHDVTSTATAPFHRHCLTKMLAHLPAPNPVALPAS